MKRLFLAVLYFSMLLASTSIAGEKPNIILVLIDDMGWSDLSCFGNTAIETPNMDRLAADGVVFTRFYVSSPLCSPSRCALTTGQYPYRLGISSYLDNRARNAERGVAQWLDPSAPTLAKIFKNNGYATGHFGKWHLGGQRDVGDAPLITEYGFDESLTNFEGLGPRVLPLLNAFDGSEPKKYSLGSEQLGRQEEIQWENRNEITSQFVEKAVDFMKRAEADGKPFYLNLWPDDVHSPFFPGKELQGDGSKKARYHGVLVELDRQLAPLFDYVRNSDHLRNNTLILVMSDNGPENGAGSSAPLRGSKATLYEGGVRSPLIVWGDGLLEKKGVKNEKTVFQSLDLVPSLLTIAGITVHTANVPTETKFDGEDVSEILLGKTTERETAKPIFWRRPPDRPGPKNAPLPDLALRKDRWKFLMQFDGSNPQLYDIEEDISESNNLAKRHTDLVTKFREMLLQWNRTMPKDAGEKPNIILIMSDDMGYSDLGCYGGEISTPNLDRLASGGVRFTQFYNTARCCPTRASLLTGLHPHQAGIGHMMQDQKLPGYTGELSPSSVTIAEVLRPAGYSTYGVGKWHVTQQRGTSENRSNWPAQRGFDRFYGIIDGATNYFEPASLVRDNTPISHLADAEYQPDDYYFTDAISDNAAKYVRKHGEDNPGKPFFMYVAYTAAHWPMQAREKDIAQYEGKYDAGYEAIRKARFERMQEMGLIDPRWGLTPKSDDWSNVKNKDWEARCMEVYAAMIDTMDHGVGRIVDSLKETGQYENTVILFLQDNGACAENVGRTPRKDYPGRVENPVFEPYSPEKVLHKREESSRTRDGYPVIHGPNVMPGPKDTFIAYGRGWANVSNTPFREYKHWVHEGGISTPLIIHAPSRIAPSLRGTYYREYGQLVDIMATCVDLAGVEYPKSRNEMNVTPMQGTSLTPALQGKSLVRNRPLFWEHEGNRAIRDGKWKLVARGPQGAWELYDMEKDRSELHNLLGQHPEIAARLAKQWENWAEHSKVFPWPWGERPSAVDLKDGVKFEMRFEPNETTKTVASLRDASGQNIGFKIHGDLPLRESGAEFDGKSWIEVRRAPALNCAETSWSVETEIEAESSDAVLVSQGGAAHGYSLYLKGGKPGFAVRIDGEVHKISAREKIAGRASVTGIISAEKKLVLRVDGKIVAQREIPDLIRQFPVDTLVIGFDDNRAVLDEELPPLKGKMERIVVSRGEPANP